MKNRVLAVGVTAVVILVGLYWVFGMPRVAEADIPTSPEAIARGEYLTIAAGCAVCHQEPGAEGMTGGHRLESPFGGAFYVPNITPDPETGIGGWTGRDFILAMKHGRTPNGSFYFPAFPYRSYAGLSDEEVLDMAAYIMAQPAIRNEVPNNDIPVWQFRWLLAGWNMMADWLEGEYPAVADDPQLERGAYLARYLEHCGECHTPRNALGIMQKGKEFQGSDIVRTPIDPKGLSRWTHDDFVGFLEFGMTASFDFVGTEMLQVVERNTALLTAEDREALAAFFTRDPEPAAE